MHHFTWASKAGRQQRSRFFSLFGSISLAILLSPVAWAHEDDGLAKVELTPNLYMLSGNGGNLGVFIGEDGTFLIDDQFAADAPKIKHSIDALGADQPRFVINTHFHGDHTGGNEILGKEGSLIVAHDNVRPRLETGYEIAAFQSKVGPADPAALPVITYSADMSFHMNGDHVLLFHVPGAHTDGDTLVRFEKANAIHAGDTFFNGFFPFIDTDHGGSLAGVISALEVVDELSDANTKIIPGHGPLASKKDVQNTIATLSLAYERLRALKEKGMTAEQAIAEQPLEDIEKEWGGAIFTASQWIAIVYKSIDREEKL